MEILNLPEIDCNIRKKGGKTEIFDIIRKKFIVLNAEEWVRQHFVHYLINHLNYPKALFKVESGLSYNTLKKRSDILVFDRNTSPFLLVECKSYKIKLNQAALEQIGIYNKTIGAKYLVITNGINHFCCEMKINGEYQFLSSIPLYEQ